MIGRLRGTLAAKSSPGLLVDVGGVGYEVDAPLSTICELPAVGEEVCLLTHFVVREDVQALYGFLSDLERETFRSLIRISGVGPKLALAILSGLNPIELSMCVHAGDASALVRLPGVGKKTAQRLLVELKDRLPTADGIPGGVGGAVGPVGEALAALQALGYKAAEASRLVQQVEVENRTTEDIVRLALRGLNP